MTLFLKKYKKITIVPPIVILKGAVIINPNNICCNNSNTDSEDCQERQAVDVALEVDGKFTPKKKDSIKLADCYNRLSDNCTCLNLKGRASRVRQCGDFLEFHVFNEPGTKAKLTNAMFCRDRLCPMCNWRRSLKIFGQVSQIMDFLEEKKYNYKFVFLTLTVRNCVGNDLSSTLDKMQIGWQKLIHKRGLFKGKKTVFKGYYKAFEVTHNLDEDTFHPHIHIILAVKSSYFKTSDYLKQDDYVRLWKECMSLDYDPICDVRTVKPNVDSEGNYSIKKAVAEVAKYAVKSKDYLLIKPEDTDRTVMVYLNSLTQRRLVSFGGCFQEARKQLNLDDVVDGNLLNTDNDVELRKDLEYMVVRYNFRCGVYEQTYIGE